MRRNTTHSWLTAITTLAFITPFSGCGGGNPSAPSSTSASSSPVGSSSKPTTIAVAGPTSVIAGAPQQFKATVANSTSAVQWQVNGVAGGSSTVGSITSSGIYTPPSIVPSPNIITISAAIGAANGKLGVTVMQPVPTISSASLVSTDGGATALLTVNGSSFNNAPALLLQGSPMSSQSTGTILTAMLSASAFGKGPIQIAIENSGPGEQTSGTTSVPLQLQMASARAAGRLLAQSTFGATMPLIRQVQSEGLDAYLDEQIKATPTEFAPLDITVAVPAYCDNNINYCIWYSWWQHAMESPDQLRQRIAFALTDMFVVAGQRADTMPTYLNALSDNSLGNWRQLMHDVTLSLAMGGYLNMFQSAKPTASDIANENYAREFMQLFSLGIYQMNMDGSLDLDASGNPIPNYTPAQIQAFARAYTGWTYPVPGGGPARSWTQPQTVSLSGFMSPYDSQHDTGSKAIISGVVLPAGQTAEQDLDGALDAIFQHPSLPPFVCKQLIQHLVTSNPSPDYIKRIAQVFVDNGNGVRGDMSAVVRAILLDPEARLLDDPNASQPEFGHLQEPILWATAVTRGLQPTKLVDGANAYQVLEYWAITMNETPFNAPSVFNFFSPSNQLPNSTLLAPEFGIENTATTVQRLLVADWVVTPGQAGSLSIDYSPTGTLGTLVQAGPDQLLAYLNTVFLHGTMTSDMRQTIEAAMESTSDPSLKARTAVYLVITSSAFKIIR
ncbi:MAG: DUF1800 family protein [Edaphobacter sp.]|uniref:DUF1800 domain-containing protein n=1 Tax=Edaphobacter sp. TaxID=1934404 RepID=UPI002397498C|nr:DUF1800 family protein [Edaphobacter sp.]MDE1178836.1 DUF1800 family protein [Edaphobacter sp.]